MEELSYSLHLSNDKNKSKKARRSAKNTETGTTSLSNNAIQNHQQLSKVDKHNLRKYDDDKELICTIKGTSSVVEDTKNLYLELFEDARIKYNEKQKRNDRKIENYFNHISNDNKRDLACEIIIEIGDMDFWVDKDDKYKKKMTEVFKEQIKDLEEVVPNFKISNATIHYGESSPHLHIVGVPFKDGMKNGMEKQVGKSDVFTKVSLKNIQDKTRVYCINSFNRIYNVNYTLKEKEEGRNIDINVANMKDYNKFTEDNRKTYVDVALATSAAPTYLPIHNMESSQYVDGGVWANNPSLVGLMEFLYQFAEDERFDGVDILSISSLELPQGNMFKCVNSSFLDWGSGLVELFSIGQARNIDKLFQFLDGKFKFPMHYVRVANASPSLEQIKEIDMDNASKKSLEILQSIGEATAINAKMKNEIEKFFTTGKTI